MEGQDKRLDYIQGYTLKTMKLKADKWVKFVTTEENKLTVNNFFEKPDVTVLVIYLNSAAQLTANLGFPPSVKSKAVYFVKRTNEFTTNDNIKNVLVGDISASPVEQLTVFVEEVRANSANWSGNV